jgi:chromate reductase
MDNARAIRILGISGSLRRSSHNTGLLRAAQELLPDGVTLTTFDIGQLPHYNADLDGESAPESVRALKRAIAEADGLLFVTPEYNYSVPGVLKNAIDWASRTAKDSPLNGKPVAMMGAGGTMGTVRAQAHLRQILLFNGTMQLAKPEVYIQRSWEKFDPDGNLTDEASRKLVRQLLEQFARWIRQVHQTP